MSARHVKWLLGELEELVARAVLTPGAAERLRGHYAAQAATDDPGRLRELLFAILGALLVGGGVILLVAHNWTELSRPARTALSFAPLVAAQLLAAFGLWRGRRSAAWREATALAVTLAVAASIALIGQTYHIPGDLGSFLRIWMLLILPLAYLFDAALPMGIYLIGIVAWAGFDNADRLPVSHYWLFLLLALPFVLPPQRRQPPPVWAQLLGWTLAATLPFAVGMTTEGLMPALWTMAFPLLYAGLWLEGGARRAEGQPLRRAPLAVVGALGVVGIALALSYEDAWRLRTDAVYRPDLGDGGWITLLALALIAARIGWLLLACWRRGDRVSVLFGVVPAFAVCAYGLTAAGWILPEWAGLLLSLYLAALGVGTMASGLRAGRAGAANTGLGVLAVLIVARFFDSDLPILARGIAFVLVGVGFLLANRTLSRRLRAAAAGDGR